MAAGSDSLATEEALSKGIAVIACLAAPLERFESDYPEAERPALRARLARCARIDLVTDGSDREAGFLAVKSYLNRYSHILVAFWDGVPSTRPGGTADVVQARLSGSHLSELGPLTAPVAPDVGPVIQIVTAREGAPRPERANEMIDELPETLIAKADVARDVESALKCLDTYNADIARQSAGSTLEPGLASLRRWTADCAERLQATTNRYLRWFFALGGVTALLTVAAEESWRIVAIALAFGVYRFAVGRNYQNRYQDYRAFSEAMRVQLAWNSAGLTGESVDVAYLKMYQSELVWIRMAIRAANLIFTIDPRYAGTFPPDGYVAWVTEQARHLRKAAVQNAYQVAQLRKLGFFAIVAGVAIGIVPFAISVLAGLKGMPHGLGAIAIGTSQALANDIHRLLPWIDPTDTVGFRRFGAGVITIGVLFKALLSGYAERQQFDTNAKRYSRIQSLFADGERRLEDIKAGKPGDAKEIVRQLGREALVEHADWLLARRDRPLVLVQGG
jgi:hypothetical protein